MNCWEILGLEPTNDKRAIKRAYATLLKQNKDQAAVDDFQQLREALDDALHYADQESTQQSTAHSEPESPKTELASLAEVKPQAEASTALVPESTNNDQDKQQRQLEAFYDRLVYHIKSHGHDPIQWQVIFHDPLLDDLETKDELAFTVFQIVAEAYQDKYILHPEIVEQLTELFSWRELELQLSEKFPPDYFEFLGVKQAEANTTENEDGKSNAVKTMLTVAAIIGLNVVVFYLCLQLVS